jgi:hypothetical protein
MPAILEERDFDAWLKGDVGKRMLNPAPIDALREWKVSTRVNRSGQGDDDPTLIEPVCPLGWHYQSGLSGGVNATCGGSSLARVAFDARTCLGGTRSHRQGSLRAQVTRDASRAPLRDRLTPSPRVAH